MIEIFAALADSSRLRILETLRASTKPVGEIAAALDLRQPQVSKHLAVLKTAGLVDVEHQAQRRIYRLRADGLRNLDSWLAEYRSLWEARFLQLDSTIARIVEKKVSADEPK